MTRLPPRRAAAVVVLLACAAACGNDSNNSATTDGTLRVYAAASLKVPFEELAAEFERSHPDTDVELNFAGSSDLATQIAAGAPADVFASANGATMDKVADEGLLSGTAQAFATNILTIAVAEGNPLAIDSLESLEDRDLAVVLCAPQVPCGAAALAVQRTAGVSIEPVSEETSVTDVLGKVSSGQADAGLVYVTDIASAEGAVEGIAFDAAAGAVNTYPIAATASGGDHAREFVALVTGADGKEILSAAGFGIPAP